MEYITLPNSDLKVSRLCMGGCPLGEHGWGRVDHNDLINAIESAASNGITMFDTADIYGLGTSEELLGEVLQNRRSEVVIASKFGVKIQKGSTTYDNSKKWIRKAVEGSLKRLKTDYIDLYQIHYRDKKTPLSDVVETLESLITEGKIRYYGLSNINFDDIDEITPFKNKFVSFQDEYSLANRKFEKMIFELQSQLSLTPMTWGSLGQGILTGKYTADSIFGSDDRRSRAIYTNFHGEELIANLHIVEKMKEIALFKKHTVPSIAIRFILDFIKDSVVLVGIKNEKQLISNLESTLFTLSDEEIQELLIVSNK